MIIIIGITILIFGLILFIWKRNNLTLLEILTIGLFVSTINQNILDIITSNLKYIQITEEINMFWASFLNRSFLIPLLIILFVSFISTSRSIIPKVCLWLVWVLLLTGVEYTSELVGIIQFTHWHFGWSIVEWSSITFAAICARKLLYYFYSKGNSYKWSSLRQ
jgi:hypothetical protein